MKTGITAHMVVKNEDQWIWFAIQSVLPHVDEFFITDTGSTDHTIEIIRAFKSPKIHLAQTIAHIPSQVTAVRQAQIANTTTDWIWLVDGDEVYPESLCVEIKSIIINHQSKISGIIVRRFDLLGDIYHRQSEEVGFYKLHNRQGHFVTRLVNRKKIEGLNFQRSYPNEGLFDTDNQSIHDKSKKYQFTFTSHALWHSSYLKRSSLGSSLANTLNRSKYKIEIGLPITDPLPEVFSLSRPEFVPDPLKPRSLAYELAATIITPIKQLKRKLA